MLIMQKLFLTGSDVFVALNEMRTDDIGKTWSGPRAYRDREQREASDFLCYQDHAGLFADFHSLRHFFITSLERSDVSPKMAQTLARHSDIRLTLGVYTHVALHDQSAVIERLPGPSRQPGAVDVARVAG